MKSSKNVIVVPAVLVLVLLLATGSAFAGNTTFVSTDFNMKHLDRSLWTLTSPSNDGQIAMVDRGTASAAVRITTPAGSAHDIWTSGDNTVRIMQPATDTPFNLEVKFLTGLVGGTSDSYQAQGVTVEQDANNKIIFAFTTATDGSVRAYVATFIGGFSSPSTKVFTSYASLGQGPLWMRVVRLGGNVWKQLCSLDGATWDTTVTFTQPLAVAKVGPFADNAGPRAAKFSSYVDYFFNLDSVAYDDDSQAPPADANGPWIHSIQLLDTAPNGAMLAWCTDELSDAKVEYGKTTTYDLNVLDLNPDYYHSVLLTDLSASTLYNFRILAGDDLSHVTNTSNDTFSTRANVADVTSHSDGFSGAALNGGIWGIVNPRGDAVVSISSDQLSISVPSGTTHDLWSDGDNMPRVTQNLSPATSHEFIVRYNTGVSGNSSSFQFQGLVFRETDTKLMRVDFLSDPSGTLVKCWTFAGLENPATRVSANIGVQGMTPLYMRVRQTGAHWFVDYSFDGSTWTPAGDFWAFFWPNQVGISAGNSGATPPAFIALVDFFQGAMPAAPRLDSPLNDATALTLPVTVAWGVGIGATSYHAQVAMDSLFSTMVVNDSTLASPTKILSTLQTDQKYFWRVRSKNVNGYSAYSDVWHFTTAQGVPGAPVLLAPLNNAVNVAVDQTLQWNATKNALTYYLQFGKDALFTSPIVNDSTLTDTLFSVTGLELNTVYFWRVRVTTPGGTGPFSPTWRFTTVVPPPGAVTLSLPVQNALITKDSVRFVWFKAQPSVTKYWLEYAPDIAFQFAVIDSSITDTAKTVKQIPNNSSYYWRLKAKNLSGWGSFGEVRIFRVEITSVNAEKGIPTEFTLAQNFPNPFNPSTRIEFGVPHSGHVILEVFNTLGDRIATVLDETMEAGYHQVSFDGSRFATGIYFYRLVTDHTVLMKKMALVK